jgi:hypothetical protein
MRERLNHALWTGLVVLAGCSTTMSSREVHTSGLAALIDITAERDQAVVSADVVVDGKGQRNNTHVALEDGDQLVASCGTEQQAMLSLGNGSYEARFPRGDGEFVVSLLRTADLPALRSVGALPVPFEITSSFGDRPLSRANDLLTVLWAPSGSDAEVTVELESDCVHSEEFQVTGDPGSFVIEPGRITAWNNQKDETCNVALRVVRTRKGVPDPRLGSDSSVVLRQIRNALFISAP